MITLLTTYLALSHDYVYFNKNFFIKKLPKAKKKKWENIKHKLTTLSHPYPFFVYLHLEMTFLISYAQITIESPNDPVRK